MTETRHPTVSNFPEDQFERFREESISRTGEPGIYWKTIVEFMDEIEQLKLLNESLQKQIDLYELMFLVPMQEEDSEDNSPEQRKEVEKPVTLGNHRENR